MRAQDIHVMWYRWHLSKVTLSSLYFSLLAHQITDGRENCNHACRQEEDQVIHLYGARGCKAAVMSSTKVFW